MYINNHTAVWGSFYDKTSGKWGYACCHSIIHVSYCAGQAGIEATEASSATNLLKADTARNEPESSRSGEEASKLASDSRLGKKQRVGESGEVQLDSEKLDAALRDERKRRQRAADDEGDPRDKRRKYNSFQGGHEVTEEGEHQHHSLPDLTDSHSAEMEAYRLTKISSEDPMANYRDEDGS